MKKENKLVTKKTEKSIVHENQNIHDFNPSQFIAEDEVDDIDEIKKKKEKAKKEDGQKSDE